jgi:hypothetical protein
MFPRLAIQIARSARPELSDRPIALFAGVADAALVSAVSAEGTAAGIETGMTAEAAHDRCPAMVTLTDNANECLEVLERIASIIHTNATPNVAIASREHVFIDLRGLEGRFADEAAAAGGIAGLVRSRAGLDVRAAVGSTGGEALAAARRARRFPIVCAEAAHVASESPRPPRGDISAVHAWRETPAPVAARARLVRMLAALEAMLAGRGESFRQLHITLRAADGAVTAMALRTPHPYHHANEALEFLATTFAADSFDHLRGIEVRLARLGPNVEVAPWRQPSPVARDLVVAASPVQRSLLRAS